MKVNLNDFSDDKRGGDIHVDGWGVRLSPEMCVYYEGEYKVSFYMRISGSPRKPSELTARNAGQWDAPYEKIAMKPGHWDLIKERLLAYLTINNEAFVITDK